jgi:hypothetical protein
MLSVCFVALFFVSLSGAFEGAHASKRDANQPMLGPSEYDPFEAKLNREFKDMQNHQNQHDHNMYRHY